YTYDFGQPLLGGGRYDGALLPHAAGFALGLGRLLAATNGAGEEGGEASGGTPVPAGGLVLSLDDAKARVPMRTGYRVLRARSDTPDAALAEARALGARYLATAGGLRDLGEEEP